MDSFVYCWSDLRTGKLYVGSHRGSPDDGYVCSSRYMLEEYHARPGDFRRQVVATGIWKDMLVLEESILRAVDARDNPDFYNLHNRALAQPRGWRHSEKTKHMMSSTRRGRKIWSAEGRALIATRMMGNKNGAVPCSAEKREKIRQANTGKRHSLETKMKMSAAAKTRPRRPHSAETRAKISAARRQNCR